MKYTLSCWLATVAAALLAATLSAAALTEAERQVLKYAGPDGIVFTVTADGLSSIKLGERELAHGGWYAWNAGPTWFARGSKDVLAYGYYSAEAYKKAAAGITAKTIEVLGPDQARVRHVMPNAVATFDYFLHGEDVTITARLENLHPTAEWTLPAMGGLRFSFSEEPHGVLPVWHTSYLAATWLSVFHPSHLTKLGGSWAADAGAGVGLTPLRTGLARTLFFWDYDAWNPDTPARRMNRWLTYLRPESIPPGGALTFEMQLRVSRSTDWKHLLEPYKTHFRATFGDLRYATDYRAVAVAHVNRNAEAIGPQNPYGFHGGPRRLDLPEGVDAFCQMLIPGLKVANGQGVILWGQGGQEPRGEMYRADFDVLPPEVEKSFAVLKERFAAAGLRLGVTTRPRHLHVRLDWQHDGTIDINPRDPQHLAILWGRFKRMIDGGCTLYYLDSFGNSLEDVRVMQYLREKMGPGIATFVEHQCDAIAPYSAFYSETDFWAKGSADWVQQSDWYPRVGTQFLETVNWLLDRPVPCISRGYDIHGTVPAELKDLNAWFYRHHLTPMIEDYTVGQTAPALKPLQEEWLDAAGGQWRR